MLDAIVGSFPRWNVKTVKPFGKASSGNLRISLGDLNPEVTVALAVAFTDVVDVEVVQGNLLDLSCDGIISPANSFGDMGGGIDKVIDDFHQGEAQRRVMAAIAEHFFGELPVGAALIVELPSRQFPFVVAAPTMRIPGCVAGSLNAYLSMRAALVAVVRFNAARGSRIRSLAIPGLGTGVGGMTSSDAAEQMKAAHESVIGGRWREVIHAAQAPFAFRGQRLKGHSGS